MSNLINSGTYTSPVIASDQFLLPDTEKILCNRGHLPNFTDLSEAQYIKINNVLITPHRDSTHAMLIDTSSVRGLTVAKVGNCVDVVNNRAVRYSQEVISDIQIQGTEWWTTRFNNYHALRPRTFDTTKQTNGDSWANFTVRIVANRINQSSDGINNTLQVTLSNQHWDTVNSQNKTLINGTTVSLSNQGTNTFWLPFHLVVNSLDAGDKFSPKLTINANVGPGAHIQISEICIYDSLGVLVVEDNFLNTNLSRYFWTYSSYSTIISQGFSNYPTPIIQLSDEPGVGSFVPTSRVADYIQSASSNMKFFIAGPEGYPDSDIVKRLFNDFGTNRLNKLYIAPDPYRIGKDDDTNSYVRYRNNLYYENTYSITYSLRTVKNIIDLYSGLYLQKPTFWTVQQCQDDGNLRMPTTAEVIAEGYISLLANCKGLLYWTIRLDNENQGIYKKLSNASDLLLMSNLNYSPKTGMKAIGDFLNTQVVGDWTKTQGEILLNNDIPEFSVVSKEEGYSKTLNMGASKNFKVLLKQVEIIDPSTRLTRSSSGEYGMAGFGTFEKNDTTYLLITNLDHDTSNLMIRLTFHVNPAFSYKFIQISDLANTIVWEKYLPANGQYVFTLPAKGASIFRLVLTNANDPWHGFPKGKAFGVQRVENGQTTLYLSKNFSENADAILYVPGTANKIFMTDFGYGSITKDNYQDIGVFSRIADSVVSTTRHFLKVQYMMYTQGSDGAFTHRATKILNTGYEFDPTYEDIQYLDIFPMVGDFNNDGTTDFGYAVRDPECTRYYISMPNSGYTHSIYDDWFDEQAYIFPAKRFGQNMPYIYLQGQFIFGRSNNEDTTYSYWYSDDVNIPFVGDWGGDDNSEYGLYANNNEYGLAFRPNCDTNLWEDFDYPFGNVGDKPFVWQPAGSGGTQKINVAHPAIKYSFNLAAFPNPFNPATTLKYEVPDQVKVNMAIYDILGRQVEVLVDEVKEPGNYSVRFNAYKYGSGIYFCRLTAGQHSKVQKLLMLK
jgi:hypothetical protein